LHHRDDRSLRRLGAQLEGPRVKVEVGEGRANLYLTLQRA